MIKATLIGIKNYNYYDTLDGCHNDVKIWAQIFFNKFGIIAKEKYDIDKKQTVESLEELISSLNDGDIGVFFFSGHGVNKININNTSQRLQGIVTSDDCILFEKVIREKADGLHKNAKLIFILDACYSGGIAEAESLMFFKNSFSINKPKEKGKNTLDYFSEEEYNLLNKKDLREASNKITILSACDVNEYAYEKEFENEGFFGFFSYYSSLVINENNDLDYITFIEKVNEKISINENDKQNPELYPIVNNNDKLFY